ncbi:hypothetical protein Rhe02_59830 [Rhizocola hellebori]|uniref:GAF domain-containing protein n=1 Tax=Rhizocola hellebori TaxID=1392758 RepID=A0A8J3VJB9_9ACTN|nr:GAF domain-containing protein [Rhizocola hellebori]GIH07916.1 hypothetical protein Rhe02_59830 [Rhizocola hellebori]
MPSTRIRSYLAPVLTVLLPVVGVISTALAAERTGYSQVALVAVVVITTAGASVLGVRRDRQAARAKEQAVVAVANLNTAVTAGGQPLVNVLGRVLGERSEARLEGMVDTLREVAITGIMAQCGRSDRAAKLRSAYYALRGEGLELIGDSVGRAAVRPPRRFFRPNDSRIARRVIEVAGGASVIRLPDVDLASPDEFEDYVGRIYRSVIAAPVRAGDRSFGLLVVDSDRPNSLTEADAEYVNLVAGILGAGYAHQRVIAEIKKDAHPTGITIAPQPRMEGSPDHV